MRTRRSLRPAHALAGVLLAALAVSGCSDAGDGSGSAGVADKAAAPAEGQAAQEDAKQGAPGGSADG
ncbi:hypothetical protein B7767_42985, partial [Streptomyces sp. 13-12-16]